MVNVVIELYHISELKATIIYENITEMEVELCMKNFLLFYSRKM